MRHTAFIASWLVVAGCSAPATLRALDEAERLEKSGKHEAALLQYDQALESCKTINSARLRRRDCAAAHLHRAELLVTLERIPEAVAAYEAIEAALPDNPTASAEGLYRAGRLRLRNGDDVGGYKQLWRCVTDYPNEQFAGDALRTIVTDGRARNAQQLYDVLRDLASGLETTRVGDNIWFHLADLAATEQKDLRAALAHYDQVWRSYATSGLFDEALWRSAALAATLGDHKGATERLRRLLATREVALGAGSYFSVWLDDAQLELGKILRDGLSDHDGAERAFTQLPRDYPVSILRDDALFELALTRAKSKKASAACATLEQLGRDWPDSSYQLEKAPALKLELGCR